MTSKLKCPFCGEKLVRHWGMKSPAIYCCDNQKCKRGGVGTEQSWQALIQSQKDLQAAKDGLLIILGSTSIGKFTKASIKEICIKTLKQITHETNSLEHKE